MLTIWRLYNQSTRIHGTIKCLRKKRPHKNEGTPNSIHAQWSKVRQHRYISMLWKLISYQGRPHCDLNTFKAHLRTWALKGFSLGSIPNPVGNNIRLNNKVLILQSWSVFEYILQKKKFNEYFSPNPEKSHFPLSRKKERKCLFSKIQEIKHW